MTGLTGLGMTGMTGLALSANIENALKEVGLLLENCRGQGYDGVSAMSSESRTKLEG